MEEASIDKVHILHVDDDPDVRLLMAGSLQEFGYAVLTAGTVAEALQLTKDLKFNLCSGKRFQDVAMPTCKSQSLLPSWNKQSPGSSTEKSTTETTLSPPGLKLCR